MHLFEAVPERLFSVLASPRRWLYADLLLDLYQVFEAHQFGIPREVLVDSLSMEIEEKVSREAAVSEGSGEEDDPFLAGGSVREQANAVIRKLKDVGWLELERRTNYEEYVTLPDYAIAFLQVIDKVRSPRHVEYRGYVYATYAALSIQDVEQEGYLALTKAYEQTQELIRELKSLNNNIRRYTERLIEHKTPREILEAHFFEYQSQILDRSYHQLKTSDNVSKYRPRILDRINGWLHNPGWVQDVARSAVKGGNSSSVEEAQDDIEGRLRFIEVSYGNMDELLNEIDRRNSQYARASLEQVSYLLSSSADTEGQLKELLLFLSGQLAEDSVRRDDDLALLEALAPDLALTDLFSLFAMKLLGGSSLYSPRRRRLAHKPEPLSADPITEEDRSKVAVRLREQLYRKMNPKRINQYVLEQLEGRAEVRAKDLDIKTMDDFVRLIFISAYGHHRRSKYKVVLEQERVVSIDGRFDYPDILIRKK